MSLMDRNVRRSRPDRLPQRQDGGAEQTGRRAQKVGMTCDPAYYLRRKMHFGDVKTWDFTLSLPGGPVAPSDQLTGDNEPRRNS